MRISLVSHGGWGGRFATPVSLDTATLPPSLADEAVRLVAAAKAAPEAGATPTHRAPEAQTHVITIEDGGASHTLRTSEAAPDPAAAALVDWIKAQA